MPPKAPPKGTVKAKTKSTGKVPKSAETVTAEDDSSIVASSPPQAPPQTQTTAKQTARQAKAKAAAEKKDEKKDKDLEKALRTNPKGLLLATDNLDNGSKLAGYLGMAKMEDLGQWWKDDGMRTIVYSLMYAKSTTYGITDRSENHQVQVRGIWELLSSEDQGDQEMIDNYLDKCEADIDDPNFPAKKDRKSEKKFAEIFWIVLLKAVIDTMDLDAKARNLPHHPDIMWHGHCPDDWGRAYYFIVHFSKTRLKHVKLDEIMDWDPPDDLKGTPKAVDYLDPQDQEGDSVNTAVFTPSPRADASLTLIQQYYDEAFDDNDNPEYDGKEDLLDQTLLRQEKENMIRDYEDATQKASKADDEIMAIFKKPSVKDAVRQRLSPEQTKAFLIHAGEQARVLYDQFAELENLNHLGAFENDSGDAEASLFYDLRAAMTAISATPPTYPAACATLGWTDEQARKGTTKVLSSLTGKEGVESEVVPTPLQIIAAAWMYGQESSAIKGGILGLDCGTGKTITTMMLLVKSAQEVKKKHALGEKVDCRPTMVLCPSSVVDVWYREWFAFFRNHLKLRIQYGTPSDPMPATRREITLDDKVHKAKLQIAAAFPPNDPDSAAGIVLVSYGTNAKRNLLRETKTEAKKSLDEFAGSVQATLEPIEGPEGSPDTMTPDQLRRMRCNVLHLTKNPEEKDLEARYDPELGLKDDDGSGVDDNTHVYGHWMKHMFKRVIADEAQDIKNVKSFRHRAFYTVYAPIKWFVSATSADNSISDNLGALNAFWDPAWECPDDSYTIRNTYGDAAKKDILNKFPEYRKKYNGEAMWNLSPRSFAHMINQNQIDVDSARTVLTSLNKMLTLRMSVATKIDVFGETFVLSDKIPHFRPKMVELVQDYPDQKEYNKVWETLSRHLSRPQGKAGSSGPKVTAATQGLRDASIHRHLLLMTFDMRLNDLNSRLTSAKSKAQVVATWHEQFNDYGATYYHKASSREPKTVPIGDNIAMAHYIIGRSQKLKYLCGQIYKYCYQQETKLLIWYELPIEGWVISMLLATLGIQFLFIGSGTNSTERNRLVGQFDKPKDPVKIAVFSAKVLATGVNMQRGCHVAIMMGLAHNINNHVQRVGRIHRYQQKHVQEIIILSLRHSYDQILEAKSNKKMVLQLLGEARTHDVIRSDDEVRQQANDELGHNPDEFKFEEFKAGLRNKDLIGQVDKLLIQSLGMSGSRLEWDDKDLFLGKGHGLRVPKQVAKVVAHNALSFIPAVAPTSEATEQDSTAATETRASTRATPTVDTATTEGTTPMELDPETPNSAQDMMDDLDSSRAENAAPAAPAPPATNPRKRKQDDTAAGSSKQTDTGDGGAPRKRTRLSAEKKNYKESSEEEEEETSTEEEQTATGADANDSDLSAPRSDLSDPDDDGKGKGNKKSGKQSTQPKTTQPKTTQPKTAQPKTAQPKTAQSNTKAASKPSRTPTTSRGRGRGGSGRGGASRGGKGAKA